MAKLIPSGVINLPNFAELQYRLNENERRKQLEFDEFSSRFDKKAGTYLDGDREAVQRAYGEVEKAMNALASDPENLELRRKLRESYAAYNQVAGTAQFLADNYRQQWSAYNANPDQFSLGGESAVDIFNRERTTKRDANQILSMASNPFTLMPKYKYDIQSPTQIADEALANFRKNINDYIKVDGSIDQDKAREYIENYMRARYVDPSQVKNAVIYEGVRQGIIGRNGEITSRSDLDIIDTEEFAPQSERLAQKYSSDAVEAFMAAAPTMGVSRYEINQRRQELALKRASQGKGDSFPRMQIRQAPPNTTIPVKYVPAAKVNEAGMVEPGGSKRQAEFTAQAVIDIPSGSSPTYLDPASGSEYKIRKVMYDLEGTPYFLRSFEQTDMLGGKKDVFDVEPVTNESLGAFSKADREFLTYVMSGSQTDSYNNNDPLGIR